jgi:hypothetical protein
MLFHCSVVVRDHAMSHYLVLPRCLTLLGVFRENRATHT